VKGRRLAGIAADAAAIIKDLQPYNAGDRGEEAILWILDELCNINKHRRILTTQIASSFIRENRISPDHQATLIPFEGGEVKVSADIAGFIALDERFERAPMCAASWTRLRVK
jgi:hypothetical protein